MNKYTVEDAIRNFDIYLEEEGTQGKENAIEVMVATEQIFKNELDKTVFNLFLRPDFNFEVERLSIFNGTEEVYKTFEKFVNVLTSFINREEKIYKTIPHLFITKDLFEGWSISGKEEKEDLIELLMTEDMLLLEEEEEGED